MRGSGSGAAPREVLDMPRVPTEEACIRFLCHAVGAFCTGELLKSHYAVAYRKVASFFKKELQ